MNHVVNLSFFIIPRTNYISRDGNDTSRFVMILYLNTSLRKSFLSLKTGYIYIQPYLPYAEI